MISTTEFKRGVKIELDGKPFEIIDSQHYKPGKGGAIVRTKLRNLLTGRVVDNTFRSGEKVEKADVANVAMQYLYREADDFVFMDMESYEQTNVPGAVLEGKSGYMKEGDTVNAITYNGRVIDVDLPAAVVLVVTQTDPGVQGDRVSGATKPATLETGQEILVPLFVNQGDVIKVDTRSGEYLGRE